MPDYRVQTDVYNGPMDLLLYLIRRDEIEIYDIPIARITQQYCQYVELLHSIDTNIAGDFLVLAATLMEIKSRLLLPRPVIEEGEAEDLSDPRLELVRQLLEYKKFKDASFDLDDAAKSQSMRWPRTPARIHRDEPAEVDLEDLQIWDLVAAFNKLLVSIGRGAATHDVVFDDTPIALHAADILDRLQRDNGSLAFEAIFAGRGKVEMIGLFLALLELIRQKRVRVVQAEDFGAILIELLSAEPIQVGEEWGAPLREAVLGEAASATPEESAQRDDPSRSAQTPDRKPGAGDEETAEFLGLDDEEAADFAELDAIKTEVDIDAVLNENAHPRDAANAQEDDAP